MTLGSEFSKYSVGVLLGEDGNKGALPTPEAETITKENIRVDTNMG